MDQKPQEALQFPKDQAADTFTGAAPEPERQKASSLIDLMNHIRELGLSDHLRMYELYLQGRYVHGMKNITQDEIEEQC